MSYAAERWARSQTVGNSTAKAVLRELAFYHNGQTGLCCPSVSKIARVLEVKKADTITAAIKRLEEGGFISREFIRDPETGQILRTEYALIGFVASEWVSSKNQDASPEDQDASPEDQGTSPEDQGTPPEDQGTSPENRGTVPQKRGRGSPEKRGEGSPENQDVTGNRNREIEQGSRTGNSLPAQAPWETDHFPDATKKVEKPKATRAKPKTSCPFSPDDPIPPEYLEYAQAKHPSINAQAEFTKFVNFHLSKDNRYSNWLAAWRTWVTKAEEFAKSRPQSQSHTPARRSTDPQAGWVSIQTPTNPPPLYTPEEREALKKKYQAMTAIFAKTDKNV